MKSVYTPGKIYVRKILGRIPSIIVISERVKCLKTRNFSEDNAANALSCENNNWKIVVIVIYC